MSAQFNQVPVTMGVSSLRRIGTTWVPRISMERMSFRCVRVETLIWKVMREPRSQAS